MLSLKHCTTHDLVYINGLSILQVIIRGYKRATTIIQEKSGFLGKRASAIFFFMREISVMASSNSITAFMQADKGER
jgi:hypothetical protein